METRGDDVAAVIGGQDAAAIVAAVAERRRDGDPLALARAEGER